MRHVASMSRGVAGRGWELLELKGNRCDRLQHEMPPRLSTKRLKRLATPAEKPRSSGFNDLDLQTSLSVSPASKGFLSRLTNIRVALVGFTSNISPVIRGRSTSAFGGKADIPRYATSLGALGLLGWRRKRKQAGNDFLPSGSR